MKCVGFLDIGEAMMLQQKNEEDILNSFNRKIYMIILLKIKYEKNIIIYFNGNNYFRMY